MPYRPTIVTYNAVRCLLCGDVIESTHVHDFKFCSCGNVAVDGGTEYLRRVFKTHEWEELGKSHEGEETPWAWEDEDEDFEI